MSASFDNGPYRRVPPPWLWGGNLSVRWQALFVMIAATIVVFGVQMFAPETASFAKRLLYTWAHEAGHYFTARLGGGDATIMVVNANGSGHVETQSSSPFHSVLISAMGNLWPALLSAYLLYVGLTRQFLHMSLFFLAIAVALTTYAYGLEEGVALTLYGWTLLCLVAALLPTNAVVAATVSILISLTLLLGVMDNIEYVFLDYLNGDTTRPSDSQQIADALDTENLREIGNTLIFLMVSFYAVSLALTIYWFSQHE